MCTVDKIPLRCEEWFDVVMFIDKDEVGSFRLFNRTGWIDSFVVGAPVVRPEGPKVKAR